MWGQRKIFEKQPSSGWKNRFWPIFLVLPVMLLKTQLFEKEVFWPSFLFLCSAKNLTKQFISAHIVFWNFLCIIKLHFVRTYKADGDFSNRTLFFPMILANFLSYCWVSRHQEAIPLAQKKVKQILCKLQDLFCTNWVKVENKIFRKKLPFQWKKRLLHFFS